MDLTNNPHGLTSEERAAIGVLRFGKGNPTSMLAITRAIHGSYTSRKIRPPANLNVVDVLDEALSKGIPVIPATGGDGYYLADTANELAEYQRRLGLLRRLTNKRLWHVAYALRAMKGMWGTNPAKQIPPAVLTGVAVRKSLLAQAKEMTVDSPGPTQGTETGRLPSSEPPVEVGEVSEGVDCEASSGDIAAL